MRPERERLLIMGSFLPFQGVLESSLFTVLFTILFTILSPICNTIATFFKYLCSGKKSYCFYKKE